MYFLLHPIFHPSERIGMARRRRRYSQPGPCMPHRVVYLVLSDNFHPRAVCKPFQDCVGLDVGPSQWNAQLSTDPDYIRKPPTGPKSDIGIRKTKRQSYLGSLGLATHLHWREVVAVAIGIPFSKIEMSNFTIGRYSTDHIDEKAKRHTPWFMPTRHIEIGWRFNCVFGIHGDHSPSEAFLKSSSRSKDGYKSRTPSFAHVRKAWIRSRCRKGSKTLAIRLAKRLA